MPEKTKETPEHVERQSSVRLVPEEDGNAHPKPLELRQPPPLHLPPSTARPGHTQYRRSSEPGRATDARSTEEHSPSLDTFELVSSQATMQPTRSGFDAQVGNAKRSLPSTSRQEKRKSRSPRLLSSSQTSSQDLEKVSIGQQSPPHDSAFSAANHTATVYTVYDEIDEEDNPKQHAMWILIYLSALAPLLSLITCLYALIATILVLVLSPLCLCMTANPMKKNFQRFLSPPLSLQLSLIYSDFDDEEITSSSSRPIMLVLVNVFAPVYVIGICMAAWVAAGFWFFAAILGDPNVKNKTAIDKDDDGKTAVMSVKQWWERWLIRGLR